MKLLALLAVTLTTFAADRPGSKDHPMISRYPGAIIHFYATENYSKATLQTGPKQMRSLEGQVTRIAYNIPDGRSNLEVFRNYEKALRSKNFKILHQAEGKVISPTTPRQMGMDAACLPLYGSRDKQALLSATLNERVFVTVYVSECFSTRRNYNRAFVEITETKEMEKDLVTVNADALAQQIAESGHVSVYGILFDFNSSVIKPESKPVLDEVAKLMTIRPSLRLYIVGHSDSQGEINHNMKLSRERAASVVSALSNQYRIPISRFKAFGVGPLSPKQSNQSDSGREQNRRVELVEM